MKKKTCQNCKPALGRYDREEEPPFEWVIQGVSDRLLLFHFFAAVKWYPECYIHKLCELREAMQNGRSSCFILDIIQAWRRYWWNRILSEDSSLQDLPCHCIFFTTSSSHRVCGCSSAQIGKCWRVSVLEAFHGGQKFLFGECLCRCNCRAENARLPQTLNNGLKMGQNMTNQ